jgi:hypothetical protein
MADIHEYLHRGVSDIRTRLEPFTGRRFPHLTVELLIMISTRSAIFRTMALFENCLALPMDVTMVPN